METNFNFKSSVCTSREQSERLLALGLKKETADMHHWESEGKIYTYVGQCSDTNGIPAWSAGRLIEILNRVPYLDWLLSDSEISVVFDDEVSFNYENDVCEAIVSCIEYLIKEGYFNKEYLCEQ